MTATLTALAPKALTRPFDVLRQVASARGSAPQHLAAQYLHRNLLVTSDGTWAYFLLGQTALFGLLGAMRDDHLNDQAERWAELRGRRVWLRMLHVPDPSLDWREKILADYPRHTPGFEAMVDAFAAWSGHEFDGRGAFTPAAVLAVRVTPEKVRREHLPKVLDPMLCTERESKILQVATEYRKITQILARPGMDAAVLSPSGLDWVFAHSRALGHILPEPGRLDRASGWTAPDVDVTATQGRDELTVRVRAFIEGRPADRFVHVLRLDTGKDRDTDFAPAWLSWFMQRPELVEVAACWDVMDGRVIAPQADDKLFHNSNIATEYRRHGISVDAFTQAGIDKSEQVANDTAHGGPVDATELRGQVLIAVHGASEQEALDIAEDIKAAAAAGGDVDGRGPGLMLDRAPAQWWEYRRFIPGEPWTLVGHCGHHPPRFVAAAGATDKPSAGDSLGFPLGNIAGSNTLYRFDPFGGIRAQDQRPGVWSVIGEQGSGKTSLLSMAAVASAAAGVPAIVSDPTGLMARLVDVAAVRTDARVIRLAEGEPGMLAPHFLVPEPDRSVFESDEDHERAVLAARDERRHLARDAIMLSIPHKMVDQVEVQRAVASATAAVGGGYGVHPRLIIEALESLDEGDREAGRFVAGQIRARAADSVTGQMVWPDGEFDADRLHGQLLTAGLTVVSSRGIAPAPERADAPLSQWTDRQLDARLIWHLGNHFASSAIWANRDRKLYAADELSLAAAGASAYTAFVSRLLMDSRKYGASAGLAGQIGTLGAITDDASALLAAGFIFRTSRKNAAKAVASLRLPTEQGWEDVVSRFTKVGQCLAVGWDGSPAVIRTDMHAWPADLIEATVTRAVAAPPVLVDAVGGFR